MTLKFERGPIKNRFKGEEKAPNDPAQVGPKPTTETPVTQKPEQGPTIKQPEVQPTKPVRERREVIDPTRKDYRP